MSNPDAESSAAAASTPAPTNGASSTAATTTRIGLFDSPYKQSTTNAYALFPKLSSTNYYRWERNMRAHLSTQVRTRTKPVVTLMPRKWQFGISAAHARLPK